MENGKTNLIVQFDKIMVNAMNINCGVFVGTNTQYGWNSHNKFNASIARVTGDGNEFCHNVNVIYDNDGMDMTIDDRDTMLHTQKSGKSN